MQVQVFPGKAWVRQGPTLAERAKPLIAPGPLQGVGVWASDFENQASQFENQASHFGYQGLGVLGLCVPKPRKSRGF